MCFRIYVKRQRFTGERESLRKSVVQDHGWNLFAKCGASSRVSSISSQRYITRLKGNLFAKRRCRRRSLSTVLLSLSKNNRSSLPLKSPLSTGLVFLHHREGTLGRMHTATCAMAVAETLTRHQGARGVTVGMSAVACLPQATPVELASG